MQVRRNGQPVVGFGLGGPGAWIAIRDGLIDMNQLVAKGRGHTVVDGEHTALEMVGILRDRMDAGLSDPPPSASAPRATWKYAIVSSIVAAATGWAIEEIARRTFRKKRR